MTGILPQIAFAIVGIAALLCAVRMICGPHPVDRVLSLDLLALVVGGLIAIHSVISGVPHFLDAVLVLSILGFMGTILLARFIEGAIQEKGEEE